MLNLSKKLSLQLDAVKSKDRHLAQDMNQVGFVAKLQSSHFKNMRTLPGLNLILLFNDEKQLSDTQLVPLNQAYQFLLSCAKPSKEVSQHIWAAKFCLQNHRESLTNERTDLLTFLPLDPTTFSLCF